MAFTVTGWKNNQQEVSDCIVVKAARELMLASVCLLEVWTNGNITHLSFYDNWMYI